jgi:hypothetical protein
MNISISLVFEAIALLFAVFFYLRKHNRLIGYFVPFLSVTVLVEMLGRWGNFPAFFSKLAMYNIFTTLEFVFYFIIFYIHYRKQTFKKLVLIIMPIFLLSVITNFIFFQGLNKTFHSYTFLLGSFFIVMFCCCYFYESVQPEKIDEQLSKQAFFWITCGLLIFYLGSVIINALFEYLKNNDLSDYGIHIYNIINRSLNVILYSSFCVAFFLCPNNRKTYSLQS